MVNSVAVTGADGFVGRHLCALLEKQGRKVQRIVRRSGLTEGDRRFVGDLTNAVEFTHALRGAEVVVHLAARAHVVRERDRDPRAAFDAVNVGGMRSLCAAAAAAEVRRIVFVSSINVNGAETHGRPFSEEDPPNPVDLYAISKWDAEQILRARADELGLEAVVVRPPLVYGAGARGNFLRLLRLAASGVPLPFGSVTNRRNLIGVENLSELLSLCVDAPVAIGQTYLAAESQVHSTTDLLNAIYWAFDRRSRLFAVPDRFLRSVCRFVGFERQYEKLCGSLEVSSQKAQLELNWRPSLSFEDGIARTAAWYLENQRAGR